LLNNCRKAFAHFGQVYLLCLIFVKNLPILRKVELMWLKIAIKTEEVHVSTQLTFIADRTTSLKSDSV